jgi:hypothetical protein
MKQLFAVVLVLVGLAIGQGVGRSQVTKGTPAQTATQEKSSAGRYQIFFSPHARADVYLLDTETGRIWHPVTISNTTDRNLKSHPPEIWIYQDRIDSEQQFDAWTLSHPSSTAPVQQ